MIAFFLFLLLFVSPVYGDAFNVGGDSVANEYYQTVAFAVDSFPFLSLEPDSIQYEAETTFGLNSNDVLFNYDLSILTSFNGMRRIGGMADRVDGPPGTNIDLIYLYRNDTSHPLTISKIAVPFSRNIPSMGDLTNILEFEKEKPIFTSIPVLFDGTILLKEAKIKEYMGMGVLDTSSKGTFLLDSFRIANPIVIDRIEYLEEEHIRVSITNRSTEKLNSIVFEYGTFVYEFDIYSSESKDIDFVLNDDYPDFFSIYNPNIKTECMIMGTGNYNWFQPSAVTVLAYREDGGWVNGAYVQPVQESFCITRLPYSMTSPLLQYERSVEDDNIEEVKGDNPREVVSEKVLGIQKKDLHILPKTAKKIY